VRQFSINSEDRNIDNLEIQRTIYKNNLQLYANKTDIYENLNKKIEKLKDVKRKEIEKKYLEAMLYTERMILLKYLKI